MRITFRLARRQTIELTLLGPAPSCATAGRMQLRGVRGDNRLDFLGRIGRKGVQPGVYVLTLTRGSSGAPVAKPVLVQIVSPRRTILLDDTLTPEAACAPTPTDYDVTLVAPFQPLASAMPSAPPGGTRKGPASPRSAGTGVLGAGLTPLDESPALPQQGSWALVILAVLVVFGLPLLALSVLGVRALRRRRIAEPG